MQQQRIMRISFLAAIFLLYHLNEVTGTYKHQLFIKDLLSMPILSNTKLTNIVYLQNITEDNELEALADGSRTNLWNVPFSTVAMTTFHLDALKSLCQMDSLIFVSMTLELNFMEEASKMNLFQSCTWVALFGEQNSWLITFT